MGGCFSNVLPRGMRGSSRAGSPNESERLSKDEGSVGLPNDKANAHLQNDEDTIRGTKDEGNANLPKDEDITRLPKDAGADNTHPKDEDNARLPDHVDNKTEVAAGKRRALLVGICYNNPSNTWDALDGPHGDVERYRILLTNTYGYRPEEIVVLKDLPQLPESSQPTRDNLIHELEALVSGAAPGDRFTFFYSGHSDQQKAVVDEEEEDGMDEMIIPSDEKPIIDDELKQLLVDPLPVGSSLLAILDTCHSGTLLDLPHYHCNSVYVPWQSKGERRTMTIQNSNVRRQATDFHSSAPPPTLETAIEVIEGQRPAVQVDTEVGEVRRADQRDLSPRGSARSTRRPRERMLFTQTRCASPEARFVCNGWCNYNEDSHPNVLSLSACSDLQRAWEGPNGSLTTVLCNYLKRESKPSYGALMAHINFQLHDNALALHEYTRHERKMAASGHGVRFDGELDNFQQPELSSLGRLNMADILQL